jgi:FkbM family methyltransferase
LTTPRPLSVLAETAPLARAAALRLGLGKPARALRHLVPSGSMRRDRRDNSQLRAILAATLSLDSNCVDVGANVGGLLEEIVRLSPSGQHVAFEPIPELARDLAERFPSVDVHKLALSDRAGWTEFIHVTSHPGYSGLRERTYPRRERIERIEVEVARLDDLLPTHYEPRLIKIDVEGGELGVLRGARDTIRRHRPLVIFEHGLGAADHYGTRPDDVWDLLCEDLGLRIFDLDGDGPYSRDEFAQAFAAGERWNYLARP